MVKYHVLILDNYKKPSILMNVDDGLPAIKVSAFQDFPHSVDEISLQEAKRLGIAIVSDEEVSISQQYSPHDQFYALFNGEKQPVAVVKIDESGSSRLMCSAQKDKVYRIASIGSDEVYELVRKIHEYGKERTQAQVRQMEIKQQHPIPMPKKNIVVETPSQMLQWKRK